MTVRNVDDFLTLCEMSGFGSIREIFAYMQEQGINCKQLFNELEALVFSK